MWAKEPHLRTAPPRGAEIGFEAPGLRLPPPSQAHRQEAARWLGALGHQSSKHPRVLRATYGHIWGML